VQIQSCLGEGQISRTPKTCISNSQMHATIKWHKISKVGQGSQHNVSHGNAMIFSWLLSSALDSSNGLDTVSAAVTHWRFWWKPNATTFFSAAPEKFEALSLNDENHMQQGQVFFSKVQNQFEVVFFYAFWIFGNPLLYWISMLFVMSCMVLASFGIVTLPFACFRNVSKGPWPLHREFFSGVCHILHISCAVLELETRILCFRNVSENNCIWCFSLKFVFKTRLVFHLCIQRCLLLFVAFWIMIWCCFKSV
jgi:hypothetical protein